MRYSVAYQRLGDVIAGSTYCLALLVIRTIAGACRSAKAAASPPSSFPGDMVVAHKEEEQFLLEGSHMLQRYHQVFDEPSS